MIASSHRKHSPTTPPTTTRNYLHFQLLRHQLLSIKRFLAAIGLLLLAAASAEKATSPPLFILCSSKVAKSNTRTRASGYSTRRLTYQHCYRRRATSSPLILQMSDHYGQESTEPLNCQETSNGTNCNANNDDKHDANVLDPNMEDRLNNNNAAATNEDGEDRSEDNNPRRGRPGIVVFSGGTAFNAASAEMASRSVAGVELGSDSNVASISRSNSMSSLMDLMAMASMESAMADGSNQDTGNAYAGGIKVWHVLPVTDDGGSTAEIVRVLGGPAVGDIRSRLLRLAPGTNRESRAVIRLLGHRLVSMESLKAKKKDGHGEEVIHDTVSRMAREEWLDILGGQESHQQFSSHHSDEDACTNVQQNYEHPLWKDVSAPYRSIIRAFLVHFHTQVLQTHNGIRQSQSHPSFDFTGGSVGNFFFAGARTFFGSLPAAIFLFSKVAGIPSGSRVLPAVLSEERLVLGAVLKDGSRIRGQYNISHPHPKKKLSSELQQQKPKPQSCTPQPTNSRDRSDSSGSNMSRHRQVVKKLTLDIDSLHCSPIQRCAFLLNCPTWQRHDVHRNYPSQKTAATPNQWSDRNEIFPEPNPLVLDAISNANCIVYGCGSLFTSLVPSLILDGVGSAISRRNLPKVLLLNGWHDCETAWTSSLFGGFLLKKMDATDFAKAVVDALDQGDSAGSRPPVTRYITHILYPLGTDITVDERSLASFCMTREQEPQRQNLIDIQLIGIKSIPADTCSESSRSGGQSHHRVFDPPALVDALLVLGNGNNIESTEQDEL